MKKESRKQTICFKRLDRGHYYNAMTIYSFRNYICSWIENVHDCHIFYFDSLHASQLLIHFESGKKGEFVSCKTKMNNLAHLEESGYSNFVIQTEEILAHY